jgi:septum formation topological specificity factor MinE
MIENHIKRETAMTKAVERERLAIMLFQERKLKESRQDPKVLLSPRAYSQTILQRPIIKEQDLKGIMESALNK